MKYRIKEQHNSSLKKWREDGEVSTYFGTLHSILPNYAIFFGPMTFLGHNSIIFIIGNFISRLTWNY